MNQKNSPKPNLQIKPKPESISKKAINFEDDEIILVDTDYLQSSVFKFNRDDYKRMR